MLASEEDDEAVVCSSAGHGESSYVAVFDPLDGSRNIDASIPTGTIFGLYHATEGAVRTLQGSMPVPASLHCHIWHNCHLIGMMQAAPQKTLCSPGPS